MGPVLQVSNLAVEFATARGAFKAVDGVSFELAQGERLGLIGESGSGKSTLALAMMRLIKPPGRITSGQILLEGVDLLEQSDDRMRQLRLAHIALVTQGVIASALTLIPTCIAIPGVFSICSPRPLYDQLATYVVFAQFVFYALSAGAVIRLRRSAPVTRGRCA